MLLKYFEEIGSENCGICDYCTNRHQIGLKPNEYEIISGNLNDMLEEGGLTMEEILHKMDDKQSSKTIKTVQWMLDNKLLRRSDDNKINRTN